MTVLLKRSKEQLSLWLTQWILWLMNEWNDELGESHVEVTWGHVLNYADNLRLWLLMRCWWNLQLRQFGSNPISILSYVNPILCQSNPMPILHYTNLILIYRQFDPIQYWSNINPIQSNSIQFNPIQSNSIQFNPIQSNNPIELIFNPTWI